MSVSDVLRALVLCVGEAYVRRDEREIARGLVEKKLRTMHGLDRQVQVRRLSGLLARKGYGAEVSRQVITEALDADPEHQRD